jgi:ribosomal protein S18 acetylase RimI-like enzyme
MENQFMIKNGLRTLQTWNKIVHSKKLDKKIEIIETEHFSDEIDEFLERLLDDYKFMFIRTSDYLNWKYSSPGNGKYTKLIAKKGKDIVGYIVLRANSYNKDYPIGYIVDLATEPNHNSVASELICRAIEYFDKKGVNIINCLTVDKHPYIKLLKGFGFINSRISVNLYTSQERPACIEALKETDIDPSRILVSWGDHDVLPVGIKHH